MAIATLKPRCVFAYQYDGDYRGSALQAIETALESAFGSDDARGYLGVRALGGSRCLLVYLTSDPNEKHADVLGAEEWVIIDIEEDRVEVMNNERFHQLYDLQEPEHA